MAHRLIVALGSLAKKGKTVVTSDIAGRARVLVGTQEDRDLELMEKEEGVISGAIGRRDTKNAQKGRVKLSVTLLHR